MQNESFYKGVGLTLISAASLSIIGLCAKLGLYDLSIQALLFWRFACAFGFYFLFLFLIGELQGFLHFGETKIQVLRSMFILSAQYCFFYYLSKNSLLNASALLNTGPLFVAVIESCVLRKKVGVSSWIAGIVAFVGALFILQPDAGIFSYMSLIGLLSGMLQGASQIVFGQAALGKKLHIGLLHMFGICALISLIPFLFLPAQGMEYKTTSGLDFVWIILLGIVSIFNQLSRASAYRYATPSRVAPFLYFSVLLAGLWDWLVFGTEPNAFSILGTALVVLGGLLKVFLRNWILGRQK